MNTRDARVRFVRSTSRPRRPWIIQSGAWLLSLSLVGSVICSGCSSSAPPPAVQEAAQTPSAPVAPPPPPPKPKAKLAELKPVTLDPSGNTMVEVSVDRNSKAGPIKVEVSGVPDGITIAPIEIPKDKSVGQLKVVASEKLGDEEVKATATVKITVEDSEAERPLELSVRKVDRPTFQPASDMLLVPGKSVAIDLKLERNGYKGPLKLNVAGLPSQVTSQVAEIAADKSVTKLTLTAAGNAPDGRHTARVAALVYGRPVAVEIPVTVDGTPFRVQSFKAVRLAPGEKIRVEVPIERRSYKGPVRMEVSGLPEGVTIAPVTVPADGKVATLEVVAAADANTGVRSAQVVSKGGDVTRKDVMVVRVLRGDSFLPEELVADPQLGPLLRRGSFGGRLTTKSKEALLNAFGGTPETEEAVLRGLRWLAAHQQEDGSWPLNAYDRDIGGCDCREYGEKGDAKGDAKGGAKEAVKEAPKAVAKEGGREGVPEGGREGVPEGGREGVPEGGREGVPGGGREGAKDASNNPEKEVIKSDTCGTAFALLPFLGAGIGPRRSPEEPAELKDYEDVVKRGLEFLVRRQVTSKEATKDGALDSNMYAHAVCTIALCEAYGLSAYGERGDERLRVPAQRAIKFIANTQHKEGGWRYSPKQAGDMSATGWMFLAIRSGQLAGIAFERSPMVRAERFVDSCSAGPEEAKQSRYAYLPGAEAKLSLSAAGLLTRQYLGWKKDVPDLAVGCQYLMQNLPPESASNLGAIYYYYYATQVLHHMEGPEFDLWNQRMREHLLRTQEKEGHKAGSWSPVGVDWGSRGGRLYATSLALMTLEVYYRHLPLYRTLIRGSGASSDEAP